MIAHFDKCFWPFMVLLDKKVGRRMHATDSESKCFVSSGEIDAIRSLNLLEDFNSKHLHN